MDPITIGALIGGGANLLGGIFGQSNQSQINAANIAAQQQINATNIAEQEKFAQQGIQWKVADAKAAGINPLAALGASTSSFSNLVAPTSEGANAFGTGVARMGQDIGRAIQATRSPEEQAVAIEKTRQDLEAGQLDNDLKRAELASSVARVHQAGRPPGVPFVSSDIQLARGPRGELIPSESADFMKGNYGHTGEWSWDVRNRVLPTWAGGAPPPKESPGPGRYWMWDVAGQRWVPQKTLGTLWREGGWLSPY